LKSLGFPIPDAIYCKNLNDALDAYSQLLLNREKLAFEADGAVIKINNLALANRLGIVGKDPRGAVAYKFPAREVTTKLMDIGVNFGRTGVLTPYAILEPVEVGGVVVKQATLHNFDYIKDKDIRIGDRVAIKRAGDVIPYVIGPIIDIRTGDEIIFDSPETCPTCGQQVEHLAGEVAWYCVNASCPAQLIRNVEHFSSRGAMDIVGLGIKIVEQLVNSGLVKDVADIYMLSRDDLLKIDGFADKKADNLIEAINNSRNNDFNRLIIALGIRGVGEVLASDLSQHYADLDELANTSINDLQNIDGVGPNIALSIVDWFKQPTNRQLLKKLHQVNVWPVGKKISQNKTTRHTLDGFTFVITGSIPGYTRDEVKNQIEEYGGKVTDSVSKNTTYLVVGDQPGSKLEKGMKLGISILDIDGLFKLMGEE
jgi:DNA ligase (NAD+)